MSDSVWQETLGTFVEQVGSAKPTPGGGAVAALSACFAAALLQMVLEIAAKGGVNGEKKLAVVQAEMKVLRRCVDEDIEVFNSFLDARKMPKVTETEKLRRQKFLTGTLSRCAEVPSVAARSALRLVPVAQELVEQAPAKVLSDVGVALSQLDSSLLGLLLNVDINLEGTASDSAFSAMRADRDRLASEIVSARQSLAIAIDQVTKKIRER
jgi:formiminotetrahydrofolate cyclodeaminase